MAYYTILKNSSLEVQLTSDYQDSGWTLVGGNAVHSNYNSGWIRNIVFRTQIAETYRLTFTVSGITTGSVKINIGGNEFTITTNGVYFREVVALDTSGFSIWSDDNVVISPVSIYKGEVEYNTLLYNPRGLFDSYISFTCDHMVSLLGSYYTFKNGALWLHNSNDIRNSFYGEIKNSILKFIFNPENTVVKNLKGIKIDGNRCWDLVEVRVQPREGKPRGQYSRLKKNRFNNLQGDFSAAFLKDMSDPRFQNELQALFEGADLQGKIAEITMEIGGDQEMRLVCVDFTYTNSNYTY